MQLMMLLQHVSLYLVIHASGIKQIIKNKGDATLLLQSLVLASKQARKIKYLRTDTDVK